MQNPAARFNYEAVRQHPFLHGNSLPAVSFPSEPQYEHYVRSAEARRTAPTQAAKATDVGAKENRRNGEATDAVRLSQIARRNADKEKSGEMYRCADSTAAALADGNGSDVHLSNPNEELDFSEDCAPGERADAGAADEDELGARDEKETFDDGGLSAAVQTIRPATPKIDWPRKHDAPRPHTDPSVYGKERQADEQAMAHTQVASQPPAAMCDSLMMMREGLARGDGERSLRQSFSDTTSRLGCAQVDDLVLHTSDLTVRPIVPNKKEDVKAVDAKLLPFEALAIERMLQLQQKELEKFLTDIYRSVGGHTSVGEKLNTLLYIESLCSDGRFCNLVCNSSLMQLFVKMVKSCKSPVLKAKLAYVIGLLVRHATFVSSELQRSGIIETFTELMSDLNEKVKRRAMGTLGELLFYAATQHLEPSIEGQPNERWEIPAATISLVTSMIAPKQDELTQLYAVKTIDNIAAQSEEYAKKFATSEVFHYLYLLVRDSKNDSLRAAAASALPRLCRHNRALTSTAYEKATISSLVALLADANVRVQLGVLNLINMLLLDTSTPSSKRLRDDADFVPQIVKLLEHSTPAIRAKGLIAVQLLVRSDPKALLKCCEAKLIVFVDRISKDKDDYILQCLRSLQNAVGALIPAISLSVHQEISKLVGGSHRPGAAKATRLCLLPILLHLGTSHSFRQVSFRPPVLQHLAQCVVLVDQLKLAADAHDEFVHSLLLLIEMISGDGRLLVQQADDVIDLFLPAVISLLDSESGEMRFAAIKCVHSILSTLLVAPTVYSVHNLTITSTERLHHLCTEFVIPRMADLLEDNNPIPVYSIKLLSAMLDANAVFGDTMQHLGLVEYIVDLWNIDHAVHYAPVAELTLRLLQVETIDIRIFYRAELPHKLCAVLHELPQHHSSQPLECALDICAILLYFSSMNPEGKLARPWMFVGAYVPHTRKTPSPIRAISGSCCCRPADSGL